MQSSGGGSPPVSAAISSMQACGLRASAKSIGNHCSSATDIAPSPYFADRGGNLSTEQQVATFLRAVFSPASTTPTSPTTSPCPVRSSLRYFSPHKGYCGTSSDPPRDCPSSRQATSPPLTSAASPAPLCLV